MTHITIQALIGKWAQLFTHDGGGSRMATLRALFGNG